ncbi:hypothetical protein DdX_14959 [Ditylenchus destructor]|uniref:Uncharacterized protein n=1 Tax=Ditylenchus destructor TaxID=166010 RepID=A0AAD4MVV5_9BILA|nr:hypothetical protein DdX_14959 [Ditylenchus destructor]
MTGFCPAGLQRLFCSFKRISLVVIRQQVKISSLEGNVKSEEDPLLQLQRIPFAFVPLFFRKGDIRH